MKPKDNKEGKKKRKCVRNFKPWASTLSHLPLNIPATNHIHGKPHLQNLINLVVITCCILFSTHQTFIRHAK